MQLQPVLESGQDLDPTRRYRAVAVPGGDHLGEHSTIVEGSFGMARLAVFALDESPVVTRAGIGLACAPGALDRSATSAVVALRLTSRDHPVLRADDLGALLILAEAADVAAADCADLAALMFLLRSQPKALRVLEQLAASSDIRTVATSTGLHPDAVRDRSREYLRALGFDVLAPRGRTRLRVALALFRLATNRFV